MDLRTAIQYIDPKDVERADSVSFNRLQPMFSVITDPRKIIGRALAVYLIHKFKYICGVPGVPEHYGKISTLKKLLGNRLDENAYQELQQMPDDEFIPFAYNIINYRSSRIANELKQKADNAGLSVEKTIEDGKPHYRGFFSKRTITEEQFKRYNINGVIEDKEYVFYSTEDLNKAKYILQEIKNLGIKGRYFIWDAQEQNKLIEEWFEKTVEVVDLFPESEFEIVDVENDLQETYAKDQLKSMLGKVYNQQKIQNIFRRKKYDDQRLFAHTKCTKCGREKRVFLSNLLKNPEKYGSCICSDKNIDGKIDYATKLYTNQKRLKNNTSGYTGVSFVKNYAGEPYNKWRAYIEVDGVRTYLGDFDAKTDAIKARKTAGEKGVKWYRQNKNKLVRDLRKKTKKYKTSKYRDSLRKTKNVKVEDDE